MEWWKYTRLISSAQWRAATVQSEIFVWRCRCHGSGKRLVPSLETGKGSHGVRWESPSRRAGLISSLLLASVCQEASEPGLLQLKFGSQCVIVMVWMGKKTTTMTALAGLKNLYICTSFFLQYLQKSTLCQTQSRVFTRNPCHLKPNSYQWVNTPDTGCSSVQFRGRLSQKINLR